jgi:hypothetical protein
MEAAQQNRRSHVGLAPRGRTQWAVSDQVRERLVRERAKVEGGIGTIKGLRYGFNRPAARSAARMGACGQRAVLGLAAQPASVGSPLPDYGTSVPYSELPGEQTHVGVVAVAPARDGGPGIAPSNYPTSCSCSLSGRALLFIGAGCRPHRPANDITPQSQPPFAACPPTPRPRHLGNDSRRASQGRRDDGRPRFPPGTRPFGEHILESNWCL